MTLPCVNTSSHLFRIVEEFKLFSSIFSLEKERERERVNQSRVKSIVVGKVRDHTYQSIAGEKRKRKSERIR